MVGFDMDAHSEVGKKARRSSAAAHQTTTKNGSLYPEGTFTPNLMIGMTGKTINKRQ